VEHGVKLPLQTKFLVFPARLADRQFLVKRREARIVFNMQKKEGSSLVQSCASVGLLQQECPFKEALCCLQNKSGFILGKKGGTRGKKKKKKMTGAHLESLLSALAPNNSWRILHLVLVSRRFLILVIKLGEENNSQKKKEVQGRRGDMSKKREGGEKRLEARKGGLPCGGIT